MRRYALLHDNNQDGVVSRAEWDEFICAGCHNNSICMSSAWFTCGDGSADGGPACRYSFEYLDSPFKVTAMLAEQISMPSGSHRRSLSDSSSASSGGSASGSAQDRTSGDGSLSADELWTPSCNLLLDMLSLKDIDPHVMLVVFLPALLFESACFGIDMGIFRRQLSQILIMAFPAMALASGITALCLYALAPSSWTFWVCWLIGIIASATDPVAVVALLKELGAAKTLGTLTTSSPDDGP